VEQFSINDTGIPLMATVPHEAFSNHCHTHSTCIQLHWFIL